MLRTDRSKGKSKEATEFSQNTSKSNFLLTKNNSKLVNNQSYNHRKKLNNFARKIDLLYFSCIRTLPWIKFNLVKRRTSKRGSHAINYSPRLKLGRRSGSHSCSWNEPIHASFTILFIPDLSRISGRSEGTRIIRRYYRGFGPREARDF